MQYCLQWMLRIIERHYGKVYFKKEVDDKIKQAYDDGFTNGVYEGLYRAIESVRDKIASYNGLSKQEWIDKVWCLINNARYEIIVKKILYYGF